MLKHLTAALAALFFVLPAYGADVSAACKDWSATSNSNNPAGSTTIGTGLDDNLREIQGSVVRCLNYKGADIATATTTDLGAVEGLAHTITGTTTITSFGTVRAGVWKAVIFSGALTLTHNATSLILPGAANITTAAGDVALAMSEGSGNWRVWSYNKASGLSTRATQPTRQVFTSGSGTYTTPTNVTRINVRMVGGGGGGGGGGAAGTAGGSTTFSTLTASGGARNGGAAGTGTNGDINISGGIGGPASSANGSTGNVGGGTPFGSGIGGGGINTGNGASASANTGAGGGGGGGSGTGPGSAGGSAGGYVEKLITAPSATYSYAVGAKGTGDAASASTGGGGDGGSGLIIVDEYYN